MYKIIKYYSKLNTNKHSIYKHIDRLSIQSFNTYLLKQPMKSEWILIPHSQESIHLIKNKYKQDKIKYLFFHQFSQHNLRIFQQFQKNFKNLKAFFPGNNPGNNPSSNTGNNPGNNPDNPQKIRFQPQLTPLQIGQFCICYIKTPSVSLQHHTIAITHYSQNSTLSPCIFSGQFLEIGGLGKVLNIPLQLIQSIKKIRGFPNQSLIFPNNSNVHQNLSICKRLQPDIENQNIDAIIKMSQDDPQTIIATTVGQQKSYNPYFRLNNAKIKKLMQANDEINVLKKLMAVINKIKSIK